MIILKSPPPQTFPIEAMKHFKPPFPTPHSTKSSIIKRFFRGWNSWIHVLFEKSYTMKMGHVKLPGVEFFIANEPSLVKQIMVTEAKKFPKHHLLGENLKPLLGDSIFTTNGEEWQRQRTMMNPAFEHVRLKNSFNLMSAAIGDMVERFNNYKDGEVVNIDVEMTHLTADIIFRTILSYKLTIEEAETIFTAFEDFQEHAQKTMVLSGYNLPLSSRKRKGKAAAKKIRDILYPIVKQRYEDHIAGKDNKNDILSTFMEAKDPKTGEPFGLAELLDHVNMLFLAGHETSASALTWSLYLIANCPHTQNKLQQEIEAVAPNGRRLAYEDMSRLSFTKNVFKEALRLYPPVGFFLRETTEDMCMRDKDVKKGSIMMIAPWLIHRNKNQWQDPHIFKPERFADKASKESIRCSYLPFGTGPRVCIGASFAKQEASLSLATLVQNFEFTNKPGHVPEPIGRVTIRPKNGVRLLIKKRVYTD